MRFTITVAVVLLATSIALADHPEVLVTPADHDLIASKVHDGSWAQAQYEKIKSQVDQYVRQSDGDPTWLASRLAMNWQTHFRTPVCEKSRFIGGEGHAPVPTPRFAGARDWVTQWSAPANLRDFHTRDDNAQGQIFLHNAAATGQDAWVDPGITGRTIESINQRVMQATADASFVYWITGDKKYARFAADALWTYMQGYVYVTAPKLPPGDKSMAPIIGTTSFEVIHEDIVTPLSISYDFLHDYLAKQGKDVTVIQSGLKRMIDRMIAGGSREGNWNLNQARIITYGALALENDDAYSDHRGRPYYVNVVLNADLPNQLGITRVKLDRTHDNINGSRFQGSFAAVITRPGTAPQLYLGSGRILTAGDESMTAPGSAPINAAVWPERSCWRYSSSEPVRLTLVYSESPATQDTAHLQVLCGEGESAKGYPAQFHHVADAEHARLMATVSVPAGNNQLLRLQSLPPD